MNKPVGQNRWGNMDSQNPRYVEQTPFNINSELPVDYANPNQGPQQPLQQRNPAIMPPQQPYGPIQGVGSPQQPSSPYQPIYSSQQPSGLVQQPYPSQPQVNQQQIPQQGYYQANPNPHPYPQQSFNQYPQPGSPYNNISGLGIGKRAPQALIGLILGGVSTLLGLFLMVIAGSSTGISSSDASRALEASAPIVMILWFLTSISGVIFSHIGLSRTKKYGFTGRGMAVGGLIMSYLQVLGQLLFAGFILLVIIVFMGAF